jgi:hypothetical protein
VLRSFVLNVLRSACLVVIMGKSQMYAYMRLRQVDDIVSPSSQTIVALIGNIGTTPALGLVLLCASFNAIREEAMLDSDGPLVFRETGFGRRGPRAAGIDSPQGLTLSEFWL